LTCDVYCDNIHLTEAIDMKCFFNDCKKEVNSRGKFCEEHDKKEREAAADIAAIFANAEAKKAA